MVLTIFHAVFVPAFNFCKVHATLGTIPAHGANLTDGPWTVEQLIAAMMDQE